VPDDLYSPKRFLFFEINDQATAQTALANEVSNLPSALAAGPVPLILIALGSITESHQVVAVAFDDSVTPNEIFLYDCRYPDATCVLRYDTASGACTLDAPASSTESWKAFFVAHYNPYRHAISTCKLPMDLPRVQLAPPRRWPTVCRSMQQTKVTRPHTPPRYGR
jgi:hypothetical protein